MTHQTTCTRRQFAKLTTAATTLALSGGFAGGDTPPPVPAGNAQDPGAGAQRLGLANLRAWESLAYGMFIHFGMSTYTGHELDDGKSPASRYNPTRLDVDSWIQIARDAGMKYAVLTAKHVSGFCLWPSRHTDYSVAHSGNTCDVVEAFVTSCRRHGLVPGFYYCSWDNHHRFGSQTPSDPPGWKAAYTTSKYQTFQTDQITELLTGYGPIGEIWIDIPGVLGRGYRTFLYHQVAALQPDCVIMMNSGFGDGSKLKVDYAWPTDLMAIERGLPLGDRYDPWHSIDGTRYYLPGEVCDPIGKQWFNVPGDLPRPPETLQNILTTCRSSGVNLLLDVGPDPEGRIPEYNRDALMRLRKDTGL